MNLPNFLVIGAAKSGTTSLYHYLAEHPQIFMSPVKELSYFAYNDPHVQAGWPNFHFPIKTIQQYHEQFSGVRNETAIGDASPIYLESKLASNRVKELIPNIKLIASLRNPADRAFSGYLMHIRQGHGPDDFTKAFNENSRYVQGGFYYARLKQYYDLFPHRNIKICLFDNLKSDPIELLHELYSFLEVDNSFTPDLKKRYNVGSLPKSKLVNIFITSLVNSGLKSHTPNWMNKLGKQILKNNNAKTPPEFPPELRSKLIHLYREDILKLQDLIDKDLSIWLENK